MSFLANLRQKQTTDTPLKLFYLLEQYEDILHVCLYIGELHNGIPGPDKKPYSIQTQHLSSPPPFLSTDDLPLLREIHTIESHKKLELTDMDARRQNQILLQKMLSTGRVFFCPEHSHEGHARRLYSLIWKPPEIENAIRMTAAWAVDMAGHQQLVWKTLPGWLLFNLQQANSIPAIAISKPNKNNPECSPRQGPTPLFVSACETCINTTAEEILASLQKKLAPDDVETFLLSQQSTLLQHKLPLPSLLPRKTVKARLEAVLTCLTERRRVDNQYTTENSAKLQFRYSSRHICLVVEPDEAVNASTIWNGRYLVTLERDTEKENNYLAFLQQFFEAKAPGFTLVEPHKNTWQSDAPASWINLLSKQRHDLQRAGFTLVTTPGFNYPFLDINGGHATVSRSPDNTLQLSFTFDLSDSSLSLQELLQQLRKLNSDEGESWIQLSDGRFLLFAQEALEKLSDEFGELITGNSVSLSLPESQLSRLKQLDEQLPGSITWDDKDKLLPQAINIYRSPAVLDVNLTCVKATLRPYQWLGVCWLQHLSECGVNGLLADDMGLGKTLQTLAFLAFKKSQEELTKPALIVLPTSLIHNWAREIKKFVPDMHLSIMHGSQRHQHWDTLTEQDMVLTSYSLIASDSERWLTLEFSWIILDEAQAIKNPQTQTSQAVRQLKGNHRLCLTGTPVENHLGELWSVFDFLMPGCLGSRQHFQQHYRYPIEKRGNTARMAELLDRIAPFLLRRNKDQVARDLPPKTITSQYIELDEEQRQCYEDSKGKLQESLQQQLAHTDKGQQHIFLLTAITRLRQICCDPALIGETEIPSAKREFCLDTIESLVDENRAVLLFSQFTRMLDLLAEDLEERNIPFLMLTGQTQQRQNIVDRFQQGEVPILLMSLKAGGVGLNLTRADTVIHYDPWWNEAAERQASDRAHRIGQTKPVFVYKLITEDTIEEKIARLQAYKTALSEQVTQQARASGKKFALELEDLLALINE